MTPLLTAALSVRAARSLPTSRRDVVSLVARPRGAVVHVAVAPLTPSGRFIPVSGRTACRARTRRLSVVPRSGPVPDLSGRRVCARCAAALARATRTPGLDGRPMSRDQEIEVFEALTPTILTAVAETAVTVDQTHELGRLASVLFGLPTQKAPAARTPHETAVVMLHDRIHQLRRGLTSAALTPEERETIARARDQQTLEAQLTIRSRRRADAWERAQERRRQGQHLLPHERALADSA